MEWVLAKSGDQVIRWQGRLLASRVDPSGEARDWFLRRGAFAGKVKSIFILGAGSGFHIVEALKRTTARVIVVEPEQELADAVEPSLAEFSARVTFACVGSARELRANEAVRAAVAASFIVLEHPASVSLDRGFFRECSAQLIGRDWGSLSWQWKLNGFPDLDSQPRITQNDKPLTIYDLEQTELVQDSAERERMLLKALRELVK